MNTKSADIDQATDELVRPHTVHLGVERVRSLLKLLAQTVPKPTVDDVFNFAILLNHHREAHFKRLNFQRLWLIIVTIALIVDFIRPADLNITDLLRGGGTRLSAADYTQTPTPKDRDDMPSAQDYPTAGPLSGRAWEITLQGSNLEQGCPAELIYSIWRTETGYNTCEMEKNKPTPNMCVSNAGAIGSLQFMGGTFELNSDPDWDIWNPLHQVRAACRKTKSLTMWDDTELEQFQKDFAISEYVGDQVWNRSTSQAKSVWQEWQRLKQLNGK